MNSLGSAPVARLLDRLHCDAEASDRAHFEDMMGLIEDPDTDMAQVVAHILAEERTDYRANYRRYATNYLAVSADYGRFLYAMARACKATRIVEFGTSMGVSTIYLAAALRDNGGGQLIGSEFEASKVERARANLAAAGFADLVDIREGDALNTLSQIGGAVDLLLIDGAFSLYLPILKLIEPQLRPGAIILGENAFDPDFLDHVGNPANGYMAQPLPDPARGNQFIVRIS